MKRIIRFLWTGVWHIPKPCEHDWTVLQVYNVTSTDALTGRTIPLKNIYDLQCKKCGDIKRTK